MGRHIQVQSATNKVCTIHIPAAAAAAANKAAANKVVNMVKDSRIRNFQIPSAPVNDSRVRNFQFPLAAVVQVHLVQRARLFEIPSAHEMVKRARMFADMVVKQQGVP
ncbi:unnamed protein product [Microthlaspi erraticum]|uniref:Uncharacterized protein n=1 Tax=Microthlaspi erraticum TaxID=1685480 RepID=A0A6D2K233_9BRAS|nr:unnamed protein product [Microthlaspi erraticum]